MTDKKSNRKSAGLAGEDLTESVSAASVTDFTGLIPAAGEDDTDASDEAYSELSGVPTSGVVVPKKDTSQAKMPQA